MIEEIQSMIETTGANVLFGIIVLTSFGLLVLAILFGGLLVRSIWRWLTRRTWGDVIRSSERKALR